jgi:hypothetical protein
MSREPLSTTCGWPPYHRRMSSASTPTPGESGSTINQGSPAVGLQRIMTFDVIDVHLAEFS